MHANEPLSTPSMPAELEITEPPLWAADGGTWVIGRIAGYRFEALVTARHEDQDGEMGESRILKLWIQRVCDRTTVFSWGEGRDLRAINASVQQIVELLATGLAERVFGR